MTTFLMTKNRTHTLIRANFLLRISGNLLWDCFENVQSVWTKMCVLEDVCSCHLDDQSETVKKHMPNICRRLTKPEMSQEERNTRFCMHIKRNLFFREKTKETERNIGKCFKEVRPALCLSPLTPAKLSSHPRWHPGWS